VAKKSQQQRDMNYQDLQSTLTSLNLDRQVNSGCNLKWKPGDERDILLATTVFIRGKIRVSTSII
jgi:hypothetical protein